MQDNKLLQQRLQHKNPIFECAHVVGLRSTQIRFGWLARSSASVRRHQTGAGAGPLTSQGGCGSQENKIGRGNI